MAGWGLVLDDEVWKLFMIFSRTQMREIANCPADGSTVPFLWARKELSPLDERLSSNQWEERTIRKGQKPGEEGRTGGRLIPMQTFDVEAAATRKQRQ